MNDKLNEGYAKGSVNRMIAILKTSLTKAVEWNVDGLERNPLAGFKTLRDPPKWERYLSPDENERLMDAVYKSNSPMLKYIIPFLLLTGARKREALDVQWTHIDFDKSILTVPLSKSGKPRFIPLPPAVMMVLQRARAKMSPRFWARNVIMFFQILIRAGLMYRFFIHGIASAKRQVCMMCVCMICDILLHPL